MNGNGVRRINSEHVLKNNKNKVTRPPRGRAFEDIVIHSFECKLAKTVGFLILLLLHLFELETKVL